MEGHLIIHIITEKLGKAHRSPFTSSRSAGDSSSHRATPFVDVLLARSWGQDCDREAVVGGVKHTKGARGKSISYARKAPMGFKAQHPRHFFTQTLQTPQNW